MNQKPNALYTCPMHPEIIRDNPGECPICGMALELKIPLEKSLPNAELIDMSKRFWFSVILTIPLILLTMGQHIPVLEDVIRFIPAYFSAWLQWLLATPVILWAGWPLLKRGGDSLIQRHLNMFTLIALGISIAYLYSLAILLFPQDFESERELFAASTKPFCHTLNSPNDVQRDTPSQRPASFRTNENLEQDDSE